ncbi:DUF234 domain-containing protein [Sulfurovum sp.]|uniref:DUF234 domain-containing protein n=1 Tax=Sulfurovum sp. TaxID=1969726 RepID=UPI0025EF8CC4|nr:DUF234 domain-containing protein [Sulfurovum sp.]
MEENIDLGFFDDLFSMVKSNFVNDFSTFQALISPSYLLETPYSDILAAVAGGDGKFYSVLKKAHLSESAGEKIVKELIGKGILYIEPTREQPLRIHPKHKIKKELRSYRIQDKLRFCKPFMRFWFGFVIRYRNDLQQRKGTLFLENFKNHYERLRSLIYEQLCNDMLEQYYRTSTPLLSHGSYWDQHSEFDLLAVTTDKKLILGECKYKERKICKNELSKLKAKAEKSGIAADVYVLFSKNGFSNELLQMKDERLLLFDLNDLKILL